MRRLPMAPKAPSSFVVYRGPSQLNGAPIVAIVTGLDQASANTKTGAMVQLWIMPANEEPHTSQRTGADSSVCGDCPKRPLTTAVRKAEYVQLTGKKSLDLGCYVKTFQGPLSTWRANVDRDVDTGNAMHAIREAGLRLRLGAFGDPAALPRSVIESLTHAAGGKVTGYTHQWRDGRFSWLQSYTMASVETTHDRDIANAMGWRTFRAINRTELFADLRNEIFCPAITNHVTCAQCGLCDGARMLDTRKNIALFEH